MTALTSRRITLLKPVPCPVCGGRERVLIGSPRASHTAVVPCLACQWGLRILTAEVMS